MQSPDTEFERDISRKGYSGLARCRQFLSQDRVPPVPLCRAGWGQSYLRPTAGMGVSGFGLEVLLEALPQLHQLGRDDREAVGIALAFAVPILLVVVFCRVPFARLDRGHRALAGVVVVPALDRRFGLCALLVIQGKDGAAVLGSDVAALAVELGRVVRAEEDVVEIAQRKLFVVEGDAHAFGMAGRAGADLLVGGVRLVAADVSAFDLAHADHVLHHRFGAPEASACDNRLLLRHVVILLVGLRDRKPLPACHPVRVQAGGAGQFQGET